jgi:two-component system OmpR family sensor kinase
VTADAPGSRPAAAPATLPWHRRLSLRTRLLAVVVGLLVVALAATGVLTVAVLRPVLVQQKDDELVDVVRDDRALRRLLDGGPGAPRGAPSQFYVLVTRADGSAVIESAPDEAPDHVPRLDAATARADGAPYSATSGDGTTWRVSTVPRRLASTGEDVAVSVALPTDDIDESLRRLTSALLLLGAAVVAACALLGWVAVRRAFRPLEQVEEVAAGFGAGDTSRRVEDAWPGTEVGRLGASVNAMLDRIETTLAAREASESRMRRFVGDASHELRTPLAAVRGFAELYRMGAVDTPERVSHTFRRIEDESTRMGGLVDDLLLLARMDESRPMRRDPLDLLALAADAVHDARALAPDRTVTLRGPDGVAEPGSAPAVGDDAHLRQVVTNLLANAVRHTPPGSPIELGVGRRGPHVLWQVVDHGPGIPPEQAERIFERFYRADASRSRGSGGGSGLGLAIVSAIVSAHGGAARVLPTPGGGATFEVALPAADPPTAADGPELPGSSQV